jgi:nitrite reductase (NO-forming)
MTAWGVTIAGGVIVAEVVIWHAVDLIRRMRRALPSRFGSTVRYYVVASLLLPFGIYLGLLLVPDDLPESTHAQLALAHVSTNLLGWMGLTVLGTLVTLWPTMLHTQVDDTADRSARRALPVLAVGIAVLAVGALAGARPVALCGLLGYLAGVVIVGGPLVREARRRMPTTYATWSVAAALTWFVGCVVVLGVILATAPDWESAAESADRLGVPLLVGFAAQLLVGALSFLIPVVLGGGPAMARATGGLLDSAAALRVAFINAGVLIGVLPVADGLRRAAAAAVLLCFGAFLVLAVAAVVTARRVESPS